MYGNGKGAAQGHMEAVWWYRKSAEQGNAMAQGNLGVMYGNGKGVAQDHMEAVRWFRKAAEQGVAMAQFNLYHLFLSHPSLLLIEHAAHFFLAVNLHCHVKE